jgi:hypothetical protein
MTEPIKAGDECVVIGGALGTRSMNLNRRVIVMGRNGEELVLHTPEGFKSFGQVWRCRSKDGLPFIRHDPMAFPDVPRDQADFAAAWLQKADPLPPKTIAGVRDLVAG